MADKAVSGLGIASNIAVNKIGDKVEQAALTKAGQGALELAKPVLTNPLAQKTIATTSKVLGKVSPILSMASDGYQATKDFKDGNIVGGVINTVQVGLSAGSLNPALYVPLTVANLALEGAEQGYNIIRNNETVVKFFANHATVDSAKDMAGRMYKRM